MRVVLNLFLLLVLFFPAPSFAKDRSPTLTEEEMAGKLGVSTKRIDFLTIGDKITVAIPSETVMPGDRLVLYSIVESQAGGTTALFNWNRLVEPVGRFVVTSIHGEEVLGEVEAAIREISIESYVNYDQPPAIQNSRYFGFLKDIVTARLKDPIHGKIRVAILDVTDLAGNVTRISEEIYQELSNAVCERPQFECVDRKELADYLNQYEVATSTGIGRYLRKSIGETFSADLLITATADTKTQSAFIYLTGWDLKEELKTPEVKITAPLNDYSVLKGQTEDILVYGSDATYGYLKVVLNNEAYIKNRPVNTLYTEELEPLILPRYRKSLGNKLSDDVILGNVQVSIGNRVLKVDDNNTFFDGIIKAKNHRIFLSVTPVLRGESQIPVGRSIEKQIVVNVPPDGAVKTEIILKTYGNQAIIAIDKNPLK